MSGKLFRRGACEQALQMLRSGALKPAATLILRERLHDEQLTVI